ncbi:hypothetical protein GCM10022380_12790 [Amycolatopsis tucumanensis]|uniref:Uncharacterized protein n=1 Tax=Amycolatopsis tucumanensis TaxID=401106 RepID=A0ABP7HJQ4_9PSEU
MFAGATVPRTSQYGAAPGTTLADWMVTGASVTPVRSRPGTSAQSIAGGTAGRFASPSAVTRWAAAPGAGSTLAATSRQAVAARRRRGLVRTIGTSRCGRGCTTMPSSHRSPGGSR